MKVKALGKSLLDLILPPRCAACASVISEAQAIFCPLCQNTLQELNSCRTSSSEAEEIVTSPFVFGGALATAIYRLKYGDRPQIAHLLGALLKPQLTWFAEESLLVPVPLHPKRLRQRGYNQAALLVTSAAQLSSSRRKINYAALARVRDTLSQAKLDQRARWLNVQDAFVAWPPTVSGREIILVDDVLTTGATVAACRAALIKAGAIKVHVLTLARAMPSWTR